MHIQPNFRVNRTNGLDAGLSGLLTAMQPAAVTFFPADAVIYAEGDAAGPLYLVEFGTIRICRTTADGRRLVSAFHTAGEVFGFECDGTHGSYAESVDGAGIRVLRPNCSEQPTGSILTLALKSLARTQSHLMLLGRRTRQRAHGRAAARPCRTPGRREIGLSRHAAQRHRRLSRHDLARPCRACCVC